MDELLQFTGSFDFAVFVFGPDDLVTSRREDFVAPRDNVLLEAGMFYASLGRRRTFALVDRSRSVKVPSDMLGMTIGTFLQPSDDNYKAATATACNSLATAITRIGLRDETTDETERALPSSPRAWPNVEAARDAMQESAQRSRKLRILTNGGFTYFGHDSSVIGTAAAPEYRDHLRRVMVLVLSPASRWVKDHFSSTRRAHQSTVAIARELEASQAILRSGLERFCRDAMVSGEMRYHTSEPYFRMLVTDQMAFVQTYAGAPGSQMRDQPVFAFDRREMGSLYGAFHRHFNDLWHNHASPTEAHIAGQQTIELSDESAGAVVIARDSDGRPHVALLMRFNGTSWGLPKGHREPRDEAIERTVMREVSEELGLDTNTFRIVRQVDRYSHDRSRPGEPKLVTMFLVELIEPGCPPLHPDPEHPAAEWFPLGAPLPDLFHEGQRKILVEAAERHLGISIEFTGTPV